VTSADLINPAARLPGCQRLHPHSPAAMMAGVLTKGCIMKTRCLLYRTALIAVAMLAAGCGPSQQDLEVEWDILTDLERLREEEWKRLESLERTEESTIRQREAIKYLDDQIRKQKARLHEAEQSRSRRRLGIVAELQKRRSSDQVVHD